MMNNLKKYIPFGIVFLSLILISVILINYFLHDKNKDSFYYIDNNDILWTVDSDLKKQIGITKRDGYFGSNYLTDGENFVYINDNKNLTMRYKNKIIDNIGFLETDNVVSIDYFKDGVIIFKNLVKNSYYDTMSYIYYNGEIKRLITNSGSQKSFYNALKKNLLNNNNLFWTKENSDKSFDLYKLSINGELKFITDLVKDIYINPSNTDIYYILKNDDLYSYDIHNEKSLELIDKNISKFILNDDGSYYIVKRIDDILISKEKFINFENFEYTYEPTIFDERYIKNEKVDYKLFFDDKLLYGKNSKSIKKTITKIRNLLNKDIRIPCYDLYFVKDGNKKYLCEDVNYIEIVDKFNNDHSNNLLMKSYKISENICIDFIELFDFFYGEDNAKIDLNEYLKNYVSYYILTGDSCHLLNINDIYSNEEIKGKKINTKRENDFLRDNIIDIKSWEKNIDAVKNSSYKKYIYLISDDKNVYLFVESTLYRVKFTQKVVEKLKLFDSINKITLIDNNICFTRKDSIKNTQNEFLIDDNEEIQKIDSNSEVFMVKDNFVFYRKTKTMEDDFLYDIYKFDVKNKNKIKIVENIKYVEKNRNNLIEIRNEKINSKKYKAFIDFENEDYTYNKINKKDNRNIQENNQDLLYYTQYDLILNYILKNDNIDTKKFDIMGDIDNMDSIDHFKDEVVIFENLFFDLGEEYEDINLDISDKIHINLQLPNEKNFIDYDYFQGFAAEHEYNDALKELLEKEEKNAIISMLKNDFKFQNMVSNIKLVDIEPLVYNDKYIIFRYNFSIELKTEILKDIDNKTFENINFNYAMKYDIDDQSVKFYNVNFHR